MLNPLALPQAVVDSLAVLPAIAKDARRATAQMEQMIERADRVIEQTDLLLDRFDVAQETIAELVDGGRRLEAMGAAANAEAAAVRETIERSAPVAEALSEQSGPMLEMSERAREELARANELLAAANEQVARVIEMGGPIEKASDRLERVVGRLRRDTPEPGESPG